MSAVDDITDALSRMPKPKAGWERVILVGFSARGSIEVIARAEQRPGLLTRINGARLQDTNRFGGWEIVDINRDEQRWQNVKAVDSPDHQP